MLCSGKREEGGVSFERCVDQKVWCLKVEVVCGSITLKENKSLMGDIKQTMEVERLSPFLSDFVKMAFDHKKPEAKVLGLAMAFLNIHFE